MSAYAPVRPRSLLLGRLRENRVVFWVSVSYTCGQEPCPPCPSPTHTASCRFYGQGPGSSNYFSDSCRHRTIDFLQENAQMQTGIPMKITRTARHPLKAVSTGTPRGMPGGRRLARRDRGPAPLWLFSVTKCTSQYRPGLLCLPGSASNTLGPQAMGSWPGAQGTHRIPTRGCFRGIFHPVLLLLLSAALSTC